MATTTPIHALAVATELRRIADALEAGRLAWWDFAIEHHLEPVSAGWVVEQRSTGHHTITLSWGPYPRSKE